VDAGAALISISLASVAAAKQSTGLSRGQDGWTPIFMALKAELIATVSILPKLMLSKSMLYPDRPKSPKPSTESLISGRKQSCASSYAKTSNTHRMTTPPAQPASRNNYP
jgi:hypothetical protein